MGKFHARLLRVVGARRLHAARELRGCVAEAEHIGDVLLGARAVTYLSVALRRAGSVLETADAADRVAACRERLEPDQQPLAEPVATAVRGVLAAADASRDPGGPLERAVELARTAAYI